MIAFTSDFVPKMLYIMYEGDGSFANYVNDSLSYYNASKLDIERDEMFSNVTVCRFVLIFNFLNRFYAQTDWL